MQFFALWPRHEDNSSTGYFSLPNRVGTLCFLFIPGVFLCHAPCNTQNIFCGYYGRAAFVIDDDANVRKTANIKINKDNKKVKY